MTQSLTVTEQGALAQMQQQGELDELFKPLIREIHLFDSFIAGTALLADPAPLGSLTLGEKLTLRRETSRFDDNEIVVLNEAGKRLGTIPEKDNVVFARLMDAGKLLCARVSSLDRRGSLLQIAIGIYLVDF